VKTKEGENIISEESKLLISIKAKKRWQSKSYRKKMSLVLKGLQAGKNNPNYGGVYSRKRSVKEKISKANKGRKISEEEMARRIQSWKTRPSKLEKMFDDITPPEIRYTGDGAWWRKLDEWALS